MIQCSSLVYTPEENGKEATKLELSHMQTGARIYLPVESFGSQVILEGRLRR